MYADPPVEDFRFTSEYVSNNVSGFKRQNRPIKIKHDTNFTMGTQQLQKVDNRSIILYSNHSISV